MISAELADLLTGGVSMLEGLKILSEATDNPTKDTFAFTTAFHRAYFDQAMGQERAIFPN